MCVRFCFFLLRGCECIAQEMLRDYFLHVEEPQPMLKSQSKSRSKSKTMDQADIALRDELVQLKITIDTLFRSQLFEVKDRLS